jgi:flagellar biosynthesis/type III secretory pathway protein FliH
MMKLFVPGRLCLFGEHTDWAGHYRTMNADIAPGAAIVTGIEQGIEQGKAEGIEQGIEQNLADNIKSLMDTSKFDFTQAVELLKVEEKRIPKLKEKLGIKY